VVFILAEILRAEEFLRADDVRTLLRRSFSEREGFLEIGGRIGRTSVLEQTESNFGHDEIWFR
jgi:hypothetical protein